MFALLQQMKDEEALTSFILLAKNDTEQNTAITEEEWGKIWNAISEATFRTPEVKRLNRGWLRAAAAVIILAGITAVFYTVKQKEVVTAPIAVKEQPLQHDVAPGGNKAVLILADGSSIVLDSAHNGSLAQQGNTKILKLDAGQLS